MNKLDEKLFKASDFKQKPVYYGDLSEGQKAALDYAYSYCEEIVCPIEFDDFGNIPTRVNYKINSFPCGAGVSCEFSKRCMSILLGTAMKKPKVRNIDGSSEAYRMTGLDLINEG